MKKYFLISVALMIYLFGCNDGRKDNHLEKKQGQITLIFNDFPKANSLKLANQAFINSPFNVNYLNDNFLQQRLFFNSSRISDTIRINTQRNIVEVELSFKVVELSNLTLHNGDTVLFTYKNDIPTAKVINRKTLRYDLDFDILRSSIILKGDIPVTIKYSMPHLFGDFDLSDCQKWNSFRDSCVKIIKVQFSKELSILDSLQNKGLISNDVYLYKKRCLTSKVYNFKRNGVSYEDISIIKILADTTNYLSSNDTLLYYNYYRSYLLKNINIRFKNIPFIQETNGSRPDYCAQFDTICKLNFISDRAKEYFLIEKLRNILDECSSSEIDKYQKKFKNITADSAVLKTLLSKYNIDFSTKSELQLLDINGKNRNFDSIIANHKESVIYVDFWASWCHPCRESMPFAKKLREEYQGKNVVFLYLAFNDQEKAWKEAITKLALNSNCENYFITNPKTSKMIEALKVKSIPRCMLFDKKGTLVNQNAPGPQGEAIRNEINKLLIQN